MSRTPDLLRYHKSLCIIYRQLLLCTLKHHRWAQDVYPSCPEELQDHKIEHEAVQSNVDVPTSLLLDVRPRAADLMANSAAL